MSVNKTNDNEAEIDLVELLGKLLGLVKRYYYVFAIGIALAIGIAYLYIKTSEPVYEVYTSLIVEEDDNKGFPSGSSMDNMMSSGLAGLIPGNSNVDNQVFILKSYDHILNTVLQLNLDVSYYTNGFFGKQIYNNFPFKVKINKSVSQLVQRRFNVKLLGGDKFELKMECERGYLMDYPSLKKTDIVNDVEYKGVHSFGESIVTKNFSFTLYKKDYQAKEDEFSFVMNNPQAMAKSVSANISVDRAFKQGGIVTIKMKTRNATQGINVLEAFTGVYLQQNIDKKNFAVNKMIEFVESQFDNISNSLKLSENELQSYQSNKEVVDLSAQGQIVIEQLSALEEEKYKCAGKLKYLETLKRNLVLNKNKGNIVAPALMGIEDMAFNDLVSKINELKVEKTAVSIGLNNPEMNPSVMTINAQLAELEKTLVNNVDDIIGQVKVFGQDLDIRIAKNKALIKEMPSKQMGLVNIQRGYEINSELYSQLLEKKLNYYIMKASNIINKTVVEEPRLKDENPIWPKPGMILLVALFLGSVLPMGLILLINLFDNKIKTKKDVEELTDFAFLGRIPFVKEEDDVVVNDVTSPYSESYRNLRFRLDCLSVKGETHKILVTSSFPGEGKTVTSINIAYSLAMLGKKTVMLGCDMRKPQIGSYMGLSCDMGLSSYLIGHGSLKQVIKKTDNEHLDVIVSGIQPPNPSELLSSDKFGELIEELEKLYDYIILDTPPIGLVVDALALGKYVDFNVYVARSNVSHKKQFVETISQFDANYENKVGVLLNGVLEKDETYGGYGGYGSYGSDNNNGDFGMFDKDDKGRKSGKSGKTSLSPEESFTFN